MNKHGAVRAAALAALLVLMLALLCGCGKNDAQKLYDKTGTSYAEQTDADWRSALDSEDKLKMAATVLSAADAFNAYDSAGYMNYVSDESPVYEVTKKDIAWVAGYALETRIEDISVLYVEGDTALIGVTQLTWQAGEGTYEFTSSRTATVHLMKREGGEWLFYESVVLSDRDVTDDWNMMLGLIEEYYS